MKDNPTLETLNDEIAKSLGITYDLSAQNEIKLLLQKRGFLADTDPRNADEIASEQLDLINSNAIKQNKEAEQFLKAIKLKLPSSYHDQLILIGSAAIDMHGFGSSDFDFMIPFSDQDDHDIKLAQLSTHLATLIDSIEQSSINRLGSLLRLNFKSQKVDLLLVTQSDYTTWIEGITQRWPTLAPEMKQHLKLQKLLAYLRGGSYYPNMKCLTYYALLPKIHSWFTWRKPGDMCAALKTISGDSTSETWPCTRRHIREDIFCKEHKDAYYARTTSNLFTSSNLKDFKPLPVLINSRWLQTAGLNGSIIVLSGPSCVGKSTVATSIRDVTKDSQHALSITTRNPRSKEVFGKDYYFTQTQKFQQLIKAGAFFEHSSIYNNQYGKPCASLLPPLLTGKLVIMDLHPDTVHHYLEKLPCSVTIKTIFLTPPKPITIKIRLYDREQLCKGKGTGSENLSEPDNILRYKSAKNELAKLYTDTNHHALFNAVLISGDGTGGAYSLERVIKETHLICADVINKLEIDNEKGPTNRQRFSNSLGQVSILWLLTTTIITISVLLFLLNSLSDTYTNDNYLKLGS